MKLSRIILLIVILAICGGTYVVLSQQKAPQTTPSSATATPKKTVTTEDVKVKVASTDTEATQVTAAKLTNDVNAFLDLTGTVRAKEQTRIFPITTGEIQEIHVQEAALVKAGDTLFVIGGVNGTKPLAQSQLEIAQTNYQTAQQNLANVADSNNSSMRLAELQLESAQHQADGSYIDLQVFDENIIGIENGLDRLRDTLNITKKKNRMDLENAEVGIDQLKSAIGKLEQQQYEMIIDLQNQISATNDPAEQAMLRQQLDGAVKQMDQQITTLYNQLDSAERGYETLRIALKLGDNQLLGQFDQAEIQQRVLELNQESMQSKLGLFDGSADPVRMASENLNATQLRNNTAMIQASAQVKLAKSSLEMAQNQADALVVKAPIDGLIGEIMVHKGDQVAPQVLLTQLTSSSEFELRTAVTITDAEKIDLNSKAEVFIGDRYLKVAIASVSPVADPVLKMVNVTVKLPKIFFRANQNLKVRIPLKINGSGNKGSASGNGDGSSEGSANGGQKSIFVPLDSVIIGTQEQYVFVVKDGKAHKTNVKLGSIYGDRAEVLEGLSASDQIVVEGAKDLLDGQSVKIK